MNHLLKRLISIFPSLLLVISASTASAEILIRDWNIDFGDVRVGFPNPPDQSIPLISEDVASKLIDPSISG